MLRPVEDLARDILCVGSMFRSVEYDLECTEGLMFRSVDDDLDLDHMLCDGLMGSSSDALSHLPAYQHKVCSLQPAHP